MRAKLVVLLLGVCLLLNAQPPIQKFWALNQCNLLITKLPVKPYAAYSLRKLSCTYTGPAIRVRRNWDNVTQDIGFTTTGDLDQTALLNFVNVSGHGNDKGYVTIWYDQSGNGRNAVQTATSQQPCIVNNGSIYLQNSKPSIYFANDCLNYPGSTNLGNISHSLNCVGNALYSTGSKNPGNGTGNFVALSSTAVGNQNSTLGSGNNSVSGCEGAIWLGGYSQDNGYQFGSALSALAIRTKTYSPSTNPNTYGFVNISTSYNVSANYQNLKSDIEIGDQDSNHDDPLTGYISEIFVFLSSLNDNVRLILESNQKTYYGTP